MTRYGRIGATLLALAWWSGTAGAAEPARLATPPGTTVAEHYPLRKDPHGIAGAVVVVADERIEARTRRGLKDWYMFGFDPPRVEPPVTERALETAELRLVDGSGRTVAKVAFDTPFATLHAHALQGGTPTDFVIEAAQGGFGQFTGSVGRPFVVEKGIWRFLAATDESGGPPEEIRLVRAPKTDWRVLPAKTGSEIFQVNCRPGESGIDAFGEEYLTYRRVGAEWRRSRRTGQGYCNWTDGFPLFSAFP